MTAILGVFEENGLQLLLAQLHPPNNNNNIRNRENFKDMGQLNFRTVSEFKPTPLFFFPSSSASHQSKPAGHSHCLPRNIDNPHPQTKPTARREPITTTTYLLCLPMLLSKSCSEKDPHQIIDSRNKECLSNGSREMSRRRQQDVYQ